MLRGPFLDRTWMAQNSDYDSSDIVMLGLPFDGTVSYRPWQGAVPGGDPGHGLGPGLLR